MSFVNRFRLITFDVTDTLLKFRSSPGRQYGEIGAMFGVLYDNDKLIDNFKENWTRMNKEHPNFGLKSGIGWENWWKAVTYGIFQNDTNVVDEKKLDAIASHLLEAYKTSACWEQCYGSSEILSHLRKSGVRMGVISNFDQRLGTLLKNMHIDNNFDFILNSYDAGAAKPSKEIFVKALELSKIPDITPEQVLHIGDTPRLDYLGAKAAGWNAILIHERDPAELEKKYPGVNPNHVFSSLYDFRRHLMNDTIVW